MLRCYPFKRQSHKMVKHTQTIRRQFADELLSVFDHFMNLALKGLCLLGSGENKVDQNFSNLNSARKISTINNYPRILKI